MLKTNYFLLIPFLFCSFSFFSQIESGKKPIKKEEIKPNNNKVETIKDTNGLKLFFDYTFSSAHRFLKANEPFYTGDLGDKENEKSITTHSFNIGLEQSIKKNLFFSFGLSLMNFGETFQENTSDSLLNYKTVYSSVACPIQIGYATKGKFSFAFSTGLQAQILARYKKENSYVKEGKEMEEIDKNARDINTMSLAHVSNIRFSVQTSNSVQIYTALTSVFQLTNSFTKYQNYVHKPYLFGAKIGVMIGL
jgi:hypothetical protein